MKLNEGFASRWRTQIVMLIVLSSARKWWQLGEGEHVGWVQIINVQVRDIDFIIPARLDPGFRLGAGHHSVVFVGEGEEQANHSGQNVPLNFTVSLLNHDPGHNIVVKGKCRLET